MRTTLLGTVTVAILACASPSLAQSDSDTARDELKKGYELKKAGRCDEAIPHLETSVRLDPEIKALANLSECEEQVGKLVLAHKHWGEVKQLAGVASNNAIKADAEKHANTIHARLPKLIVHLAPGAPSDTQVTADETPLSAAALAAPILIDPGAHVIMVRAQGHDDQSVSVTLVEGEQKENPRARGTVERAPTCRRGFAPDRASAGADHDRRNPTARAATSNDTVPSPHWAGARAASGELGLGAVHRRNRRGWSGRRWAGFGGRLYGDGRLEMVAGEDRLRSGLRTDVGRAVGEERSLERGDDRDRRRHGGGSSARGRNRSRAHRPVGPRSRDPRRPHRGANVIGSSVTGDILMGRLLQRARRGTASAVCALSLIGCGGILGIGNLPGLPEDGGPGSGGGEDGGSTISSAPVIETKVDLLFMIDNSASMGDKQAYLATAIPNLVTQLVATTQDIHIGIVSSSLGPRLGDQTSSGSSGGVCLPTATITLPNPAGTQVTQNNHNDDSAHLLQRSSTTTDPTTEVALADNAAGPTQGGASLSGAVPAPGSYTPTPGVGFLAWFPSGGNAGAGVYPETSQTQLRRRLHGPHYRRARVRMRNRVAARELVPLPHPAGSVREPRPERPKGDLGRRGLDDHPGAPRLPPPGLASSRSSTSPTRTTRRSMCARSAGRATSS